MDLFYSRTAAPKALSAVGESFIVYERRGWDDYGFGTTFDLTLHKSGEQVYLGATKIARRGMVTEGFAVGTTYTDLPQRFEALGEEFFSVGQDATLYKALLNKVGRYSSLSFLNAIRDLAVIDGLYEEILDEPVAQLSLFRYVGSRTVQEQYRRIISGDSKPLSYELHYLPNPDALAPVDMTFAVDPDHPLPTNLHVIIGANGTGKTTSLRNLRWALDESDEEKYDPSHLRDAHSRGLAGLVSISFSAFDVFPAQARSERAQMDFRVTNVVLPSPSEQADRFQELVEGCLEDREHRLLTAVNFLAQADPVLERHRVGEMAVLRELPFVDLSSGHKIALLMIASLVRFCEEKTLVLIDEPESHLHPPLLGALARALSWLMSDTNSLAIVATHSPIVLQEVPTRCAWKIWGVGDSVSVEHPTIQTLGENLGVLSREVFGVELDKSGYHGILRQVAGSHDSYAEAVKDLNGEIGEEAKLILRSMMRAAREGR